MGDPLARFQHLQQLDSYVYRTGYCNLGWWLGNRALWGSNSLIGISRDRSYTR